jgi:bacterioferritin (cytochrome b1)
MDYASTTSRITSTTCARRWLLFQANTGDVNDFATREILEHILQDEDAHVDRIEELQDQIGHMALPLFLTTQVG